MGREGTIAALVDLLRAAGATEVRVIPAADIVVDERVRMKCRVPLCDSFHRNLMCPPFVMSVEEFRRALAFYSKTLLLQVSAPVAEGGTEPPYAEVFAPANRLHELINLGEREAFQRGYRFAAGFIGGCCRLCERCVAADGGRDCRHPFRARPSMEAVGVDVVATVERAGLSSLGFPIASSVTWTGLILLE